MTTCFTSITSIRVVAITTMALTAATPEARAEQTVCGGAWEPVASGLGGEVKALLVASVAGSPRLVAGGTFLFAGQERVMRIASWDGRRWSAVDRGFGGRVESLTTATVGPQTSLYAGGVFNAAIGGPHASCVAGLDGSDWMRVGSGMSGCISAGPMQSCVSYTCAYALIEFDFDGSGPQPPSLVAAGDFSTAGGVASPGIARWDGQTWSPIGAGFANVVQVLGVFQSRHDAQPVLYAGGRAVGTPFNSGSLARWNGQTWSPMGISGGALAMISFDDGSGPALYVGGRFSTAGGVTVSHIARWDGQTWSALGTGVGGGEFPGVIALAVFDDGSGPALYAGGRFTMAGGVPASNLARWDGREWAAVGDFDGQINALEVFDDGSGPALFAGGQFTSIGGVEANYIARLRCFASADLNQDGVVNGLDLGLLLVNWSIPPSAPGCGGAPGPCPSDLNADGVVNGLDLGLLLASWTL
jgi:hypothetical protein